MQRQKQWQPQLLPAELLAAVFHRLRPPDLAAATRTSTALRAPAERVLYRHIYLTSPVRAVQCLRSLGTTRRRVAHAELVRSLTIELNDPDAAVQPLPALYRLLARTLERLTLLTSLSLELPSTPHINAEDLTALLLPPSLKFALTTLATSLPAGTALAAFLSAQPRITDLCLHGFASELILGLTPPPSPSNPPPESNFFLHPSALPSLASFRAVHAPRALLAHVLAARPVSAVSLSLFSSLEDLAPLAEARETVRRLTVMCFAARAMGGEMLDEIARVAPGLEALHVVVVREAYSEESLLNLAPHLTPLPLKYLTLVAPSARPSAAAEQRVAEAFGTACPSLLTIILPRGRLWGRSESGIGRWAEWGETGEARHTPDVAEGGDGGEGDGEEVLGRML